MRSLVDNQGIVFEYGWIPIGMIKLIGPAVSPEATGLPTGNVVPFRRQG